MSFARDGDVAENPSLASNAPVTNDGASHRSEARSIAITLAKKCVATIISSGNKPSSNRTKRDSRTATSLADHTLCLTTKSQCSLSTTLLMSMLPKDLLNLLLDAEKITICEDNHKSPVMPVSNLSLREANRHTQRKADKAHKGQRRMCRWQSTAPEESLLKPPGSALHSPTLAAIMEDSFRGRPDDGPLEKKVSDKSLKLPKRRVSLDSDIALEDLLASGEEPTMRKSTKPSSQRQFKHRDSYDINFEHLMEA
jgi:hypothetical protein